MKKNFIPLDFGTTMKTADPVSYEAGILSRDWFHPFRGSDRQACQNRPDESVNAPMRVATDMAFEEMAPKTDEKMLIRFDAIGAIEYVSDKALKALNLPNSEIIGKNILSFNEPLGIRQENWFDDLRRDFHSQNLAEIRIGNEKKWMLWDFEAQLNLDATIGTFVAIGHEITDFIKSNTNYVQDKNRDYLTGLLNRQGLHEQLSFLEGYCTKAVSYFIDCWTFSKIVDYYGHQVSEEILLLMANELEKNCEDGWLLARYAESQFVIVCTNGQASEEQIKTMVRQLENNLVSAYSIRDFHFQVDKRIGYAVYPEDTRDLSKLVSLSSLAMKESIKLDQISVKRYQKYMSETLEQNVLFARKLHAALDLNQVEIYFQKIMDVGDDQVFSFEELARWRDSELGIISPKTMFTIAKEANMTDKLERYLVEKAVIAFKSVSLLDKYRNVKLALNLTPASLLDPHFLAFVDHTVRTYGLRPSDISVEISECTFVNSVERCIQSINEYKSHGYGIAIDDFGREYSSLAILENVAFDIIKIDALFIDKIAQPKNQEIVKMIYKIAKIANSRIIAEGVETLIQKDILKELGCTLQQGYFFHRPDKISTFFN